MDLGGAPVIGKAGMFLVFSPNGFLPVHCHYAAKKGKRKGKERMAPVVYVYKRNPAIPPIASRIILLRLLFFPLFLHVTGKSSQILKIMNSF